MIDPAPPTTPTAPHRTVSPGLTATLRGLYYAAAATGLGALFATVNETRRFADVVAGQSGSLSRLRDAEEVSAGLTGLFGLCGMVLAVLTIIWWYQSYQAIERAGVSGRSWSSGWAVGAWFIPLANLIIPRLVLSEIDRVSAAAEEGSLAWRPRPLLAPSSWWWGCFVVASVVLASGPPAVGTPLPTAPAQACSGMLSTVTAAVPGPGGSIAIGDFDADGLSDQ